MAPDPAFENIAEMFLLELGEDPDREGLRETSRRVSKAIPELFSGYFETVEDLDLLFKDFETKNDCMVIETGIPVLSFCEHHILPFFGTCNIGYVPEGKALGASKLVRIVNHFSRRLQLQERLTEQIAQCLDSRLQCKGVMITMRCLHLCMVYRGVKDCNTSLTTSAVVGCFKDEAVTRSEFLNLTNGAPKLLL